MGDLDGRLFFGEHSNVDLEEGPASTGVFTVHIYLQKLENLTGV